MWVFFENGTFYSAVDDRDDATVKWVRSRDLRSSQLFADFCEDSRGRPVKVLQWKNRDYDYRVEASQDEWASFVEHQVQTARATNFKSEVSKNLGYTEGREFLNALHRVWEVMFRFQNSLRPGSVPGKKKAYADEGWLGYETWALRDH